MLRWFIFAKFVHELGTQKIHSIYVLKYFTYLWFNCCFYLVGHQFELIFMSSNKNTTMATMGLTTCRRVYILRENRKHYSEILIGFKEQLKYWFKFRVTMKTFLMNLYHSLYDRIWTRKQFNGAWYIWIHMLLILKIAIIVSIIVFMKETLGFFWRLKTYFEMNETESGNIKHDVNLTLEGDVKIA